MCVTVEATEEILFKCGGSYIRISATGIEDGTKGNRTIKSAGLSEQGPASLAQSMDSWKHAKFDEQFAVNWMFDEKSVQNQSFKMLLGNDGVIKGATNTAGETSLQKSVSVDALRLRLDPGETS